jgi:hypothetical protein
MVEAYLLNDAPMILLPRSQAERLAAAGRVSLRQHRPHARRCDWAERALAAAVPHLQLIGAFLPPGRVLIVEFGRLEASTHVGKCVGPHGDTSRISVSTQHPDLEQPRAVAHVLVHELLHACDDNRSEHGGQWAWWAGRLGMRHDDYVTRNATFERLIDRVLARVGALPGLDTEVAP